MIDFPGLNLWRGTIPPDHAVKILSQQTHLDTQGGYGDQVHHTDTGRPQHQRPQPGSLAEEGQTPTHPVPEKNLRPKHS